MRQRLGGAWQKNKGPDLKIGAFVFDARLKSYDSTVFFTSIMSPITIEPTPISIWMTGVPPVNPVSPALSGGTVFTRPPTSSNNAPNVTMFISSSFAVAAIIPSSAVTIEPCRMGRLNHAVIHPQPCAQLRNQSAYALQDFKKRRR